MLIMKVFADMFLWSVVLLVFLMVYSFLLNLLTLFIVLILLRIIFVWFIWGLEDVEAFQKGFVIVCLLNLLDKYRSMVTLNWMIGLWFSDHSGMNSVHKSEWGLAYGYKFSGVIPSPNLASTLKWRIFPCSAIVVNGLGNCFILIFIPFQRYKLLTV